MTEKCLGSVIVNDRRWQVYVTIEADGSISFVRMTWGSAERQFRPGEENDFLTRTGMALVAREISAGTLSYSDGATDDDFQVIEPWEEGAVVH